MWTAAMSALQPLQIRKAAQIVGKTLQFRDANLADAAFILSLRTDAERSRHLSAVSADLADQQDWLAHYAQAEDQAYFIIEHQQEAIGTVRLYDPQGDSFCWGSWILKSTSTSHAALESALMVYAYAVDHLGFRAAHFDVRQGNERVWKFHERFGAKRVAETALDYYYQIKSEAISASRYHYRRFLADTVQVQTL
jgi:RimJ/RimL family protein N-acetyltransferase